jgi:hypothetical protein
MQIVCVAGVNDGHVAAGESVLMDVLLMLGAYIHRDPPGCKVIEFETSPTRSRLALWMTTAISASSSRSAS